MRTKGSVELAFCSTECTGECIADFIANCIAGCPAGCGNGCQRSADAMSLRALPGAPWLQRRGHELFLDGVSLEDMARRWGTPLYAYSRRAMVAQLQAYQEALAGRDHLVCYAMKANSTLAVLQVLAQAGCGFDIVSGGELERVVAAGGDPSRTVFSGVGKTRCEMQRALTLGVKCFNVESAAELEVLSQVAQACSRTAAVSLRVNPDVDPKTHPYISTGLKNNKFGVAHEQALASYQRAAQLPGLRVCGIDCHIGSQIVQIEPYLDALDRLLDLVEALESKGLRIDHLDLGGGLGITYTNEEPPSPQEFIGQLLQRLDARGHGHRQLVFEPGRSVVGNAGVLLTQVLYLKPGPRNFCVVDAGMNDLIRPAMYDAWMGIEPCALRPGSGLTWDVVGPVCESGDWLGKDRRLNLESGDYLAILSAGAYAMSMASNYNSRPRPAEIMVDNGRAQVIRARETLQHLMSGEHLLAD